VREQQSPSAMQALSRLRQGMVVVVEVLVDDVLEVVGSGRVVGVAGAQVQVAVQGRPSGHGPPSHASRAGSTRPSPHVERTAVKVLGGLFFALSVPVRVVHAGAAILPESRTFAIVPQRGQRVLTAVNVRPALIFTTAGPQASMESSPGTISTASVGGVWKPWRSGASPAATRNRPPGQGAGRDLACRRDAARSIPATATTARALVRFI
jgi:hypothetical protein